MKRCPCLKITDSRLFLGLGATLLAAGCATPRGVAPDPQIKLTAEAAQTALQHGEIGRADALYGKALARARLTDNRDETIRNAYNLALCRMSAGRLDEARGLLELAGLLASGRGVVSSRILLAQAEVSRLAGDHPRSEQLACEAMEAGADRDGTVQAWLLQGEARQQAANFQGACTCFAAASRSMTRETPAAVRARLSALEAGLVLAGVLPGSVAVLQLERAEWLKQAGQFDKMVEALQAAAMVLEGDAKWTEAFDCRIRAAQSMMAAGKREQAHAEVLKAEELAARTGDAEQRVMVTNLKGELK